MKSNNNAVISDGGITPKLLRKCSKTRSGLRGSATLIALGMGIVLLIVIAGVRSYTTYRVQNTIMESRNLKALAVAEAGLAFALSELSNNYDFQTHKVNSDPKLSWGAEQPTSQTLQADSNFSFSVRAATKGTYSGTLGDGEFKVRCGPIPYTDNRNTKNIDESKSFFKVDSMGKIGDTVRIVNAVIQRRYPGREFLMYDGGFLSLIYGTPGLNNVNKFSTGHLYGHLGIEIGRILTNKHVACPAGTDQELYDMDSIITGDGGIFLYNDIKTQFRPKNGQPLLDTFLKKNSDFPPNGTYPSGNEKFGEYPKELLEEKPEIIDPQNQLKDRMKDKGAHISIPPKPLPFETYKKQAMANGVYLKTTDCTEPYPVTPGWLPSGNSVKVRVLDFGTQLHSPQGITIPANFNGVIFADESLVIKGNPLRDVKIVSRKDVFVAGDFNQRGNPTLTSASGQNPERYGFPQNFNPNAFASEDYIDSQLLKDDLTAAYKRHQAATVIAHDRVVFDYRSPVDCFENELYPFMKYKLASVLRTKVRAKTEILLRSGSGGIDTDATDVPTVKNRIASFFEEFPLLPDSTDKTPETGLANEFANHYQTSGSNFPDADFDPLCMKVWKEFRERYKDEKMKSEDTAGTIGKFGVYKLLKSLRDEMRTSLTNLKPDDPQDFLYYPEMTTNGMFISGGKRNRTFYAGPDYIKVYDEIGSDETCVGAANVGLQHSARGEMIHRLYGSEIRLNLYDINRITKGSYNEPTRRKLYDESLPKMALDSGSADFAAFRYLTWQDFRATTAEFTNF